MTSSKPKLGRDAEVKMLARCLHPNAHLRNKETNCESRKAHLTLKRCKVIGKSSKIINGKEHLTISVARDNFPNADLRAVKRWFKAINQGPPNLFFDDVHNKNDAKGANRGQEEEVKVESSAATSCMSNFSQTDLQDPGSSVTSEEGNCEIDDDNLRALDSNP